MTTLSANVNKVAWLRNARAGARPSVVAAARAIVDAGAQGITVHPRPDRRHIRPQDVEALAELLASLPGVEFNIEGNPAAGARDGYPGFDRLIEMTLPQQATLVPDAEGQITSDHGWDLTDAAAADAVRRAIDRYRAWGVRVSLFLEPSPAQIARAKACGADRVELYTGPYAAAVERHGVDHPEARACLDAYAEAMRSANALGLGVNAGHDLNLCNLAAFVAAGDVAEVSIGHALIADALHFGLAETVRRYLAAVERGRALQETMR